MSFRKCDESDNCVLVLESDLSNLLLYLKESNKSNKKEV